MRGDLLTVNTRLAVEECCNCHTQFAMTEDLQARRKKDKETFYCPLGHPQSYTGESDEAKIKRLRREAEIAKDTAERALKQRDRAQKENSTLKARAKGGACPCCNRTFVQLMRHMKSQHPEYGA